MHLSILAPNRREYWMEYSHPHIQVPPLEASPCLQRMAPPHVLNIAVESFEKVENDKGLVLIEELYLYLVCVIGFIVF